MKGNSEPQQDKQPGAEASEMQKVPCQTLMLIHLGDKVRCTYINKIPCCKRDKVIDP